jgi:F0F1-type ATP synthase membrane subunit c/vacuolar-type H+-ATPase subunit K
MKKTALTLTLISALLITMLLAASVPSLKADSEIPQPQWSRTYPRSVNYTVNGYPVDETGEGNSVIQTADGGFAVLASINDHHYEPHTGGVNNYSALVIRTDSAGDIEWEKGYLLPTRAFFQTGDSGFILFGDGIILKVDYEGNEMWSRNFTYSNFYFFTAIQARDGGYVLAGMTESEMYNIANIIKIDVDGNLLWNKTYAEAPSYSYSRALSIVETEQGDFAVAGQQGNAWFAIIDAEGNLKTSQVFPEIDGVFNSIAETDDGGFVLVGGNQIGGINMPSKGIIVKVDSQGNLLWSHTYNNPPNVGFWFLSFAQTGDGGYIVSGYSSALFKTDASGDLEWYFSSSNDISDVLGTTNSVTATEDGGFAVVGGKNNSVWLAKFGPASATTPAETPSPFSTTLLIAAVIVEAIVIAGLVLLIYLIKRK